MGKHASFWTASFQCLAKSLLWTSQSGFLSSNWVFVREHPFIDKPMFITEPVVPSERILGLGTKLYPRNMQRMLKRDLVRFMQFFSRVGQNRESKRKVLLVGCFFVFFHRHFFASVHVTHQSFTGLFQSWWCFPGWWLCWLEDILLALALAIHGVSLVVRGSTQRLLKTPSDMHAWRRTIWLNTIRRRWKLSLSKLQIATWLSKLPAKIPGNHPCFCHLELTLTRAAHFPSSYLEDHFFLQRPIERKWGWEEIVRL